MYIGCFRSELHSLLPSHFTLYYLTWLTILHSGINTTYILIILSTTLFFSFISLCPPVFCGSLWRDRFDLPYWKQNSCFSKTHYSTCLYHLVLGLKIQKIILDGNLSIIPPPSTQYLIVFSDHLFFYFLKGKTVKFIYLFIFGRVGSSFLCEGFP